MPKHLTPAEFLAEYGAVTQVIVGDSMYPTLLERSDIAQIQTVTYHPNTLHNNDIVLYQRPSTGYYVLHRIVSTADDHVITCGDNRRHTERIPLSWVIGILVSIERNGTYYPVADIPYSFKARIAMIKHQVFIALKITIRKRLARYKHGTE